MLKSLFLIVALFFSSTPAVWIVREMDEMMVRRGLWFTYGTSKKIESLGELRQNDDIAALTFSEFQQYIDRAVWWNHRVEFGAEISVGQGIARKRRPQKARLRQPPKDMQARIKESDEKYERALEAYNRGDYETAARLAEESGPAALENLRWWNKEVKRLEAKAARRPKYQHAFRHWQINLDRVTFERIGLPIARIESMPIASGGGEPLRYTTLAQPLMNIAAKKRAEFVETTNYVASLVGTNRYVRPGGHDTNCNGLFDVDDPGSGGLPRNCAFRTIQTGVSAAAANSGDFINLQANQTWSLTSPVVVTQNSSASTPLTIRSSNYGSLPSGRVSPSDATNMPKIQTNVSGGAFSIDSDAGGIVFDGLEVTDNATGSTNVNYLFDLGETAAGTHNKITIQRSFLHPGNESDTTTWIRRLTRAVQIEGGPLLFKWNHARGFMGYMPPSGTTLNTTEVLLSVGGPGPIDVIDNYLEAHYACIFLGGGDTGPANSATVSSVTTTSAVHSNTTGLASGVVVRYEYVGVGTWNGTTLTRTSGATLAASNVGRRMVFGAGNFSLDSVAGNVYSVTLRGGGSPANGSYTYELYENATVSSVVSSTVNYSTTSIEGVSSNAAQITEASWNYGDQGLISDVLVQKNTFHIDDTFSLAAFAATGNRPKGTWEVKNVNRMTIDGNTLDGFPGTMAWLVAAQNGTAPWTTIKHVTLSNNWYKPTYYSAHAHAMALIRLADSDHAATPGTDIDVFNNLVTNVQSFFQTEFGSDWNIYHNTVLNYQGGVSYNSFLTMINPSSAVTLRDNTMFFQSSGLNCTVDGVLSTCWPGNTIQKNVVVDNAPVGIATNTWGSGSILSPIPTTTAGIGLVNFGTCASGTLASCALSGSSNYENAGTDSTDPGINVATLAAALGTSSPISPSGLNAAAVSTTQINLTWTDNSSDETGFKLERCSGSGCSNFAEIATPTANAVSYNNTGLTASTTYAYRIRATNAGGDSAYSGTAEATTQSGATTAPASIRGLINVRGKIVVRP